MELFVGVATLVLAIVTAVMAWQTWRVAEQTKRLAGESGHQLAAMREQTKAIQDQTTSFKAESAAQLVAFEAQTSTLRAQTGVLSEELAHVKSESDAAAQPLLRWELPSQIPIISPGREGLVYVDVPVRLVNHGGNATLTPRIDINGSGPAYQKDNWVLPPRLFPTGAVLDIEIRFGEFTDRGAFTPEAKVTVTGSPLRDPTREIPAMCELKLRTVVKADGTGREYRVDMR